MAHHPDKIVAKALSLFLFMIVCLTTLGQDYDWETVKKKADGLRKTDVAAAIQLLNGAKSEIKTQLGAKHDYYSACLRELTTYYQIAGNPEKMQETMTELSQVSITRSMAQMKEKQAEYEKQVRKQMEAASRRNINQVYGLGNENKTWVGVHRKMEYYVKTDSTSKAVSIFEEASKTLPPPDINDVFYSSSVEISVKYYEELQDVRKIQIIYQMAIKAYEEERQRIEKEKGKNHPDYTKVQQTIAVYKSELTSASKAGKDDYAYPSPSSIRTWKELHKVLNSRIGKKKWGREPYDGMINFFNQSSSNIKEEKLDYHAQCLVLVARAHEKLEQSDQAAILLNKDISKFNSRKESIRSEIETDQAKQKEYKDLLMANYYLHKQLDNRKEMNAINEELRVLKQKEETALAKEEEESKSPWEGVSEQMTSSLAGQDYKKMIEVFEAAEAKLGVPKSYNESYYTLLAFMTMAYGQEGNTEKQQEIAARTSKFLLLSMEPDARNSLKEITEETNRVTANREARTETADIADRLGTETPDFDNSEYYDAVNNESSVSMMKKMIRQSINDNRIFLERDPSEKEFIFDSLAREWGKEMISTFDKKTASSIPTDATFDEVYQLLENARAGLFSTLNESMSGITEELKNIGEKTKANTEGIISFFDSQVIDLQNFSRFTDDHFVAIKALQTQNSGKQIDRGKAEEMILSAIIKVDTQAGKNLTENQKQEFKTIISDHFSNVDHYSSLFDYERLKEVEGYEDAGSEPADYFESLANKIEETKHPSGGRSKEELLQFYTFMRDELTRANEKLNLFGVDEINELKLGSRQVEQWAKSREVMLQIAWKGHQEGIIDLFDQDEHSFMNYDQVLKSKAGDYKTRRFIQRGVQASKNPSIQKQYEELRQKKAEIGQVYLMPDSLRQLSGWDDQRLSEEINTTRETERALYQQITKLSDFGAFYSKHSIKWKEIHSLLRPGEAFVDIERVPNYEDEKMIRYLYVIIKAGEKPVIASVDNGLLMDGRYFRAYANLIKANKADGRPYEYYWKTVGDHLSDISKVYLSPDGIYHKLSPGTLYNPATEKYLVEELEIIPLADIGDIKSFYDESVTSLKADEYVLFGHPDYNLNSEATNKTSDNRSAKTRLSREQRLYLSRKPLKALAGTIKEVHKIDSLAQANNIRTNVYMDEQATESRLRSLGSPDVIHIATHGSFKPGKKKVKKKLTFAQQRFLENPMLQSFLFLAGANLTLKAEQTEGEEDGIVSAEDIAHLDLSNTDLVVLSACETGLGETFNGEGVFGLQRSFLTAGAKTVIMSLWTVNDKATQLLMTNFYRNMLENGLGKREAFRQAQLQVKEEMIHPHFWGAFVMVGE